MKILYDHQIFSAQVFGGISRYYFELLRRFALIDGMSFELALRYSNNASLRSAGMVPSSSFFPERRFLGKTSIINAVNGFMSKRALRAGKFDLLHPTYYDPYYLPLLGNKPSVVTVYDMTHELYPELFSRDDRTRAWKKASISAATAVVAISENTKCDLLRFYPLKESRVSVIHLASSLQESPNDATQPELPENYLLFVGQRGGYKNFPFFIKGVAPLLRDHANLFVVCAGGGLFTPQEQTMIASLGIADRVRQYAVSDSLLWKLYRRAVAFVFPSLYEGFGIPVLEAFNAGCPVLVSNSSSLPEIADNAAGYFDPDDESSLQSVVEQVVGNAAFRADLIARGRTRANGFSWDKVARETKKVYENVV
jgi:glycosyltransferase involved in cell wall biosynthesis